MIYGFFLLNFIIFFVFFFIQISVLNITFLIIMMEFQRQLKDEEDDERLP